MIPHKNKKDILVNILTRTSRRPVGFYNCRQSIVKQTYKNIKQYVSYEDEADAIYLNEEGINKVKVNKYKGEVLINPDGYLHAPYNLYCNTLLTHIEQGWILFLDDDTHLFHNKVIEEMVSEIKKIDEDTLFIWQMRYPNGKVLPTQKHFTSEKIEIECIDTTCFLFHSKYKGFAQWDQWKASDYRVISKLCEIIPKKKWIKKVYIQINNYGDFGQRNDIVNNATNKLIFHKTWFWFLIPKYHTKIREHYIFKIDSYRNLIKRYIRKIKKRLSL
ncbi:hypothetical protein [Flavobacterium ovatum]|uniref:hypothetical protein n=1 Tax=Flavobacterium ovatum TaxID=1928857 RepID=UPI00344CA07F